MKYLLILLFITKAYSYENKVGIVLGSSGAYWDLVSKGIKKGMKDYKIHDSITRTQANEDALSHQNLLIN
jgi:hypothetical protein